MAGALRPRLVRPRQRRLFRALRFGYGGPVVSMSRIARWWAAGAAGLAASLAHSVAQASPHYRLVYVREPGTETCPEEIEIRLAVTARLGYDPFSPMASAAVLARVTRKDERFIGTVELSDDGGMSRGRREISSAGAQCDELGRALALSVSIAIDPERALAAAQPAPAPLPAPVERDRAPSAPPTEKAPSSEQGFSAGALALSMVGVAPSPAFGAGVFGAFGLARLRLGLEARFVGSAFADVSPPSGASVATLLGAAVPSVCYQHAPIIACGLGTVGAITARSQGIADSRSSSSPYVALGARLGVEPAISGRVDLVAQIELWRSLTPVSVEIDGQPVFREAELTVGLGLGARVRFP